MLACGNHRSFVAVAAFVGLALLIAACASPSVPTPTSTATPGANAKTHFWISNQSLGTGVSSVAMTVKVDDLVILDKSLDVGKQHGYEKTDADLTAGAHTVKAAVATPQTTSQKSITVNGETWVLVRFWYDPQGGYLNQRTPSITVDVLDHEPGIK